MNAQKNSRDERQMAGRAHRGLGSLKRITQQRILIKRKYRRSCDDDCARQNAPPGDDVRPCIYRRHLREPIPQQRCRYMYRGARSLRGAFGWSLNARAKSLSFSPPSPLVPRAYVSLSLIRTCC